MRSTPLRFVALAILLAFSLLLTGEFEMQRRFDPQRPFRAQRLLSLIRSPHRTHTAAANDATSRSNPHQGDESEQETEDPTPAVAAPPLSAEDFKTLESLIEQPVEEEDGQENEEEGEKGGEEEEGEDQEREKEKVGWGWVGRLVGFGSQLANATWERVGGVVRGGVEVWEKREKEARSRKEWRRVVESDRRKRMEARRRGGKGRKRRRKGSGDGVINRVEMRGKDSEKHGSGSGSNAISNVSEHSSSRRAALLERGPSASAAATLTTGAAHAAAAAGAAATRGALISPANVSAAATAGGVDDCLNELQRAREMEAPWPDPLIPRNFSVHLLTLDPSRRRTGLPLKLWEWQAESVFVIGTGEPGKGRRETLLNLDRRFRAAGLQYTQVVMPMALEEPFKARYDPVFPARSLSLRSTFHPHDLAYAFAHFEVWARVVVLRLPYAMVFEDDARNKVDSNAAWKQRMEGVSEWEGVSVCRYEGGW
ncbi:unnamed protein product [Closterium sp. NIES-64]|nr:unnamed protein product [Closterium sp. NIES-64]